MLELHTTSLMWATILLLSFVCLWWFIVEWGFKRPAAQTRTASNNKPIDKLAHATHRNSSQPHKAKETSTETRTNVKTQAKNKTQSKASGKSQKLIRPESNSARSTHNRKSNQISDAANSTNISSTTSDTKTTDCQASNHGKPDEKTGLTSAVTDNETIPGATHSRMSPNPTKEHKGDGKQQNFQPATNTTKSAAQQTSSPASQPGRPETQSHKTSVEIQHDQSQSNNPRTLQAKVPANQKRTHTLNAKTNPDNKADNIEPKAAEPKAAELEASKTDNAKHNATANQLTHHNDKSSDAKITTTMHQVESNQTHFKSEKIKQPSFRTTSLDTQPANATSHKATVDLDNIANQMPPTKLKANTGETGPYKQPGKQPADPTIPRYQTAAKARHPSSRNEASLQIPTPTAHRTDSSQAELKKTEQASTKTAAHQLKKNKATGLGTSTSQSITADSCQVLPHATTTRADSIKPTTNHKLQSDNRTNQSSSISAPIPFKKIQAHGAQRKQSSIEVAVAQQITDPQTQSSHTWGSISVDEASTTSSISAKVSNDLVAKNSETDSHSAKPVDAIPAIDTDASLRAQLAASERQIKSLQSTLNSVQDDLPTMAVPATRTHLQHSRPSLLSKVRVLDQPKV